MTASTTLFRKRSTCLCSWLSRRCRGLSFRSDRYAFLISEFFPGSFFSGIQAPHDLQFETFSVVTHSGPPLVLRELDLAATGRFLAPVVMAVWRSQIAAPCNRRLRPSIRRLEP